MDFGSRHICSPPVIIETGFSGSSRAGINARVVPSTATGRWRRALGFRALAAVKVASTTHRDPDGSYKHHFLRVDPELRPILSDGQLGALQRVTTRNAVGSSFGVRGAGYQPEVES